MQEVVVVMGNPLVPLETLKAVIEAAPQGAPNRTKGAKDILRLLESNCVPANSERGLDGREFFFMYIRDLTQQFNQTLGNGKQVKERWIGQLLANLGIKSRHRVNDGIMFMWTQAQLDILNLYFNPETK